MRLGRSPIASSCSPSPSRGWASKTGHWNPNWRLSCLASSTGRSPDLTGSLDASSSPSRSRRSIRSSRYGSGLAGCSLRTDRCTMRPGSRCRVALCGMAELGRGQRHRAGSAQTFGRDLHAGIPGLKTIRPRDGEKRSRWFRGVSLAALDRHHDENGSERLTIRGRWRLLRGALCARRQRLVRPRLRALVGCGDLGHVIRLLRRPVDASTVRRCTSPWAIPAAANADGRALPPCLLRLPSSEPSHPALGLQRRAKLGDAPAAGSAETSPRFYAVR